MSNFKSKIEQQLKKKRIDSMSDDKRREYRLNTISEIINQIEDKKNRFIFYCPDITLVNPLVKLIYETALEVKNAGFNVVVLHELNGYKAKWLYNTPGFEAYGSLNVEYAIRKAGKKSKRDKNSYAFRASDTLVVADVTQDMLENIISEEALNLMQKVVLVTGYMGLSALTPGVDYNRLGVKNLIFFDHSIMNDYKMLFPNNKSYILDNYPVRQLRERSSNKIVNPVIALTSIGADEKSSQLINIFYNLYPNLSMFTFKVVGRESMETFIENINSSAGFVILDKNVITKQLVYEAIKMGVPVVVPNRREFSKDPVIAENFMVEDDVFAIAEQIAKFCTYWINESTDSISESVYKLSDKMNLGERTVENFHADVAAIFTELHQNRINTFTAIREGIENEETAVA